jgi:hypothetical protein
MRFKSSLEADYARYCNFLNVEFQYEQKTFEIIDETGKARHYTPDFYIPSKDLYIETKALRAIADCHMEHKTHFSPTTLIEQRHPAKE